MAFTTERKRADIAVHDHRSIYSGGKLYARDLIGIEDLIAGGVVTDHGLLLGLGDNDHPQYLLAANLNTLGDARWQGLDATLTALAGLNTTAGLVEQTGADAFTKRLIGVANATDILTRADGDARYGMGAAPVTSVFGRTGAVIAATNDYTWAQINKLTSSLADITTRLISDTTGTLAVARGGTGTTTFPAGALLFGNTAGAILTDSTNLFWDDTNNRLGILTATPFHALQVGGDVKVGATADSGLINLGDISGTGTNVGIFRGLANTIGGGNYLNLGGFAGISLAVGAVGLGAQTQIMALTPTGVGIFTAAPFHALQITGDVKIGSSATSGVLNLGDITGGAFNVGVFRGLANTIGGGSFLNLGGFSGISLAVGAFALGSQTQVMELLSAAATVKVPLALAGSTSGALTFSVPAAVTSYGLTWPAATTDGYVRNVAGVLSFVSAPAPGAHTHDWSEVTGEPTTIGGYGITDFNALGDARWSLLGHTHAYAPAVHTHDWADITGEPSTIGGYGITDFNSLGDARWSLLAHTHAHSALTGIGANDHHAQSHVFASTTALGADHTVSGLTAGQYLRATAATTAAFQVIPAGDIPDLSATYSGVAHTHTFASLTSKPTTIGGYGITDFNSLGDARWSLLAHTHTFASLTSKPTTLAGYGITDPLNVAQGGTGAGSFTAGRVLYGNGTSAINSSASLFFDGSQLGIGGTPAALLDITINSASLQRARITNSSTTNGAYTLFEATNGVTRGVLGMVTATDTTYGAGNPVIIGSVTDHPVVFISNNSARMTIVGSNVGIGTTTFGTNAAYCLGFLGGTAPTTSPTNVGQLYTENGHLYFRSSGGKTTLLALNT